MWKALHTGRKKELLVSWILSSQALTTVPLVCLAFFQKVTIQQTFIEQLLHANAMPGIYK